ncbi:hypothetical protein [Nonomuraea basaltis]|uniref:hypothetical protein n=1 Tax=Nonomuraea basaltis TaxID=2495887 RepID=UPI00110C4C77|nr:hypothetical protein [Nonomuraea basaltis]TMR97442.1 hypothetical protein EJK15_17965 [Nonomuraea basaltis]
MRARRDLLARVAVVGLTATAAGAELPAEASREVREKLRAEQARQFARLEDEVRGLADDAGRYLATFAGPARTLIGDYLFVQLGVILSERPRSEQCAQVLELAGQMATVLGGPRWRFWIRLNAWLTLTQTLAQLKAPEEPVAKLLSGN